jgi:hypothetical protein
MYAKWLPRIGFGVALAGFGVNHYRNLGGFVEMAKGAFPTVPALAMAAGVLAYVVPALQIAGGLLFAIGQLKCIAKICILASLGGILGYAGLSVMVGDVSVMGNAGAAIQNASIMLITFWVIQKMFCCGSTAGCAPGCTCSKGGPCICPKK